MRGRQNLEAVSGDDRVYAMVARDETGAVVNLTGATALTFKAARRNGETALITKTLGGGVAVTSATTGAYTITVLAADTADFDEDLAYDVAVTLAGLVKTVNAGRFRIHGDIA